MANNFQALRSEGLQAIADGFGLVPINPSTKQPYWRLLPLVYNPDGTPTMREYTDHATGAKHTFHARGWKEYQLRLPTENEINYWTGAGAQLAVVCGAISGGLLVIDFDEAKFFGRWYRRVAAMGCPAQWLVVQRTGGGGWQALIRCDDPGENQKLAWVADPMQQSGRKVAIETRGEGGYAVVAPSLHPSGNYYRWRQGDLRRVVRGTSHAVDSILQIARNMSEVHTAPATSTPHQRTTSTTTLNAADRVIDAFNASADIEDELLAVGYTPCGTRYHRPGYTSHSQASVDIKDNRSWHWSSNDPLSDGFWKTPFAVRLHYAFGGDVKDAVRTVARELGMDYQRGARMYAELKASAIPAGA